MQGGIHPDLPGTAYFEIASEVKRRCPDLHVHAFSPMEVVNGASRTGLPIREWLVRAKGSGAVGSLPGTAAEILDDEVRWVLTKGKLPASVWIEVISTAHELGLRTSATMMYGHVDHAGALGRPPAGDPLHPGAHRRLYRVRAAPVHPRERPDLPGRGWPGRGRTRRENRAVSRACPGCWLHGAIDSIQLLLGSSSSTKAAGTCSAAAPTTWAARLMEETISRMAGADHGSYKNDQRPARRSPNRSAGRLRPAPTTTYGEGPGRAPGPPRRQPTASAHPCAQACPCWTH